MTVKEILIQEFEFTPKFGEEFKNLPAWKRELTFEIERKAMDYRIARDHFKAVAKETKDYVFAAYRVIFEGKSATPVGIRPGNVEEFFNKVIVLREEIKRLILIYNSSD